MEQIFPNGTEVLIFKYISAWGPYQDDENYIIGTIQSSEKSNNLSIHGSDYTVQVYEVLGNDGKIYTGTYGNGLIGNSFFRTPEDHIKALKTKISRNQEKIMKLEVKNNEYNQQIKLIEEKINSEKAFINACKKNNIEVRKATNDELKNGLPLEFEDGKKYLISNDQEIIKEIPEEIGVNDTIKKSQILVKKKITSKKDN